MNDAITIKVPGLSELLDATKSVLKELGEIKILLKIDKYDERDFVTANCFCTRHSISRKTLAKRVREGSIEVDASLGVKRYRKSVAEEKAV
jgi:hypothetical protein